MLAIYLAVLDNEEEQAKMEDIYINHRPAMLHKALSLVKNKEMAEDAIHNVFLAVIKNKDKILALADRDLRAHLIVMTKNKSIDLLRQRRPFADNDIDSLDDQIAAPDMSVEDQVILGDEYNAMKSYLAQIDETSRLVLEMKYVMGMSYKEIGKELNMTAKHVDTRIMRAKEKVRKIGAKGGEGNER